METLKVIIKSIVVSCPNPVTVKQLECDFKSIEGHAFPYRCFGFKSPDEMLRRAMQDIVEVYGSGRNALVVPIINTNSKSEHIAKLVTEQKNSRKIRHNSRRNCRRGSNVRMKLSKSPLSIHDQKGVQRMSIVKEEETTPEIFNARSAVLLKSHDVSKDDKEGISERAIDSRVRALAILRTYQNEVAEKLKMSKADENSTVLSEYDKCDSGTKIEPRNIELTIVKSTSINDRTALNTSLHGNANETEDISLPSEKDKPIPSRKAEEQTYQLCMLEKQFCELHIDESKSDSNLEITVCEVSPVELDSSNSDIFVKPKKNSFVDLDQAIPDCAFDNRIFLLDFPESAVKFGTKIESHKMPDNIELDSIIPIYISEIHNPYRFWFHIHNESNELEKLMHCIERFYAQITYNSELTMLRELIQPGQVCATLFDGFWHRAEIISSFIIDDKVKVFFMDYGTVYTVDICDIKYLHSEFAKLPAFAYRGLLAEISPFGLHWTIASSIDFLSMSSDRLLYAKVCEIDLKNRAYYLAICDTHYGKLTNINLELIQRNHALKSFEWSKSKKLGIPRTRHKREDYPSFDMLERGEYPTLAEIKEMEDKGIFYESITDKMIYYPHILNFDDNAPKLIRNLPYYLLSNNPFVSDIVEYSKDRETNIEEDVL